MNAWFVPLIAAFPLAGFSPTLSAAESDSLPATTRKVVLDKADTGYRWKLVEAPVPTLGPRQVLVRVRAVSLNRRDLEMLEPSSGRDYSGLVVASDAAGEILAVGSQVEGFQPGMRVTSLYFKCVRRSVCIRQFLNRIFAGITRIDTSAPESSIAYGLDRLQLA